MTRIAALLAVSFIMSPNKFLSIEIEDLSYLHWCDGHILTMVTTSILQITRI